ncbi:MFS sugar transporter-like protein [Rhexocercosporidium sp. MPI-PUGE-AT-0058]|nr:MFS sugar transporter-like protein [Rhexocercosporidium sp. MPI-PUGE-AT-0058]
MIWVAVMGQGSPLLFDLGLPTYLIVLIWLAGPLSGVFVQHFMSILSDRSSHPWGRRRPFIVIGTMFTIVPAILLPWTAEIVDIMTSGQEPDEQTIAIARSIFAGLMIWILNVAVQPSQQVQASAYVSRITAISSILGYGFGFIDMPRTLPWLGTTQFQCLFMAAVLGLLLTVVVSCLIVKEKSPPRYKDFVHGRNSGMVSIAKQLFRTIDSMPRSMKMICKVQFYESEMSTPTAGDNYTVEMYSANSFAIRLSTMTMVLFASVSFLSTILIPMIISTNSMRPTTGPEIFIRIPWLTIPTAWAAANVFAAVVLVSTMFADSSLAVTIQVSFLGISWAISQWAPLALISTGISSHKAHSDRQTIIAAVLSSCTFWFLGRLGADPNSVVGWVIRLGVLANLGAAWIAYREIDE